MLSRRRKQRQSGATVLLILFFLRPSAQSDHSLVRHRRADIPLDTVERCTPQDDDVDTHSAGGAYRCFYRGTLNSQLTAQCPEPHIDPNCQCTLAARSPMTGFFTFCATCAIIEYNGDWSVKYDCSNLWMKQQELQQQQNEQPSTEGEAMFEQASSEHEHPPEGESVFEQAGFEESSANTTTLAPTPSVRLSSRNSRTFPPI
jgi:hypothetical protein